MDILWKLSEIRTPFFDQLFQFVTYFGQETLVIAIICALYWCGDKRFAYQLGFTYFTAGLCVQSLKITFRVSRPWVLDPEFTAAPSAVPAATGYSFPSGHTQAAASLYGSLALYVRKGWLKILFVCCFLLVGFSRMYLGVHTPKDVLVSIGISLLFAWLFHHFHPVLLDNGKFTRLIAIILAVISIAVCIYALYLLSAGTIEMKYAADCCKSAGAGLGFASGFYLERTYLNFDSKTKTRWGQVVKLFIGLGLTLFLKSALAAVIGHSIYARVLEYYLLITWVLVIYPYLFSKFSLRKDG